MKLSLVLLSGGGTLGSVTPLLAVAEEAQRIGESMRFIWVGTKQGVERTFVTKAGLPYVTLVATKWRRYFSVKNFFSPLLFAVAFFQAVFILLRLRPDVVLSAGGYVAVPLLYAAWFMRIPCAVHEQDREVGLANKLVRPLVKWRTSVWERSGVVAIGNLIRPSVYEGSAELLRKKINLPNDLTVLVLGGGTGAVGLNADAVALAKLLAGKANVVHLTGKQKATKHRAANYHQLEFTDDMADYYALADVVVCRAGLGTLSELAALQLPVVMVPMANTHQEANARSIADAHAGVYVKQHNVAALHAEVQALLDDEKYRASLGAVLHAYIPDGTKSFLHQLRTLLHEHGN